MSQNRTLQIPLLFGALILIFIGLHLAGSIVAPMAFSLFVIAIVWPMQSTLQRRMANWLAVVVTILMTLAIIAVLIYLLVWAFGLVVQWMLQNAARFQSLYGQADKWLLEHGLSLSSLMIDGYSPSWIIGAAREIGGRCYQLVSFATITFAFTSLALLEVDIVRKNVSRLGDQKFRQSLLRASENIAEKFQKYMLVRTVMSIVTGVIVWSFALAAGIELATAWGVIAFVFNYIPLMGPLFATLFPTAFALVQSESWQLAVLVFICLNVIQFVTGSYIEPRIAGATLSISPFMVLFAVFFWALLWGIPGAFIGVPIVIAILTICEEHESTKWLATLLSGHADVQRMDHRLTTEAWDETRANAVERDEKYRI